MMLRTLAWSLVWIALIVGSVAVISCEHRAANYGLPLVSAKGPPTQTGEAEANRLLAPCPLTPRNIPFTEERSA